MTNPIFEALVAGRRQQVNSAEAVIAEEVSQTLGPLPADTHRPAGFIRWCEERSLPWRPATPAVIASFVLGHTTPGKLVEELRTLSLAHVTQGLPDPTSAWPVGEALSRVVKVDPPRSWPKEMQLQFLSLPADVQAQISSREKDRDVALRRSQNDAALWRKHVEQKSKETNGTNSPPKPAQLEDRVQQLRDELDAEIDRRATELKQTMPGVPFMVVRNILTRNSDCQCAAFLHIKDSDV